MDFVICKVSFAWHLSSHFGSIGMEEYKTADCIDTTTRAQGMRYFWIALEVLVELRDCMVGQYL